MATVNELRVAVGTLDTTFFLGTTCDFPQSGVAQVESEYVLYGTCTDNSLLQITRGVNGSSAATHAAGKSVTFIASFPPDLALNNGAILLTGSAAPTAHLTGLGTAGKGSIYIATSTGAVYSNTGTSADPVWATL